MTNIWSYEGKRVVIAGCFSGMGEAAARQLVALGAEVHGVDINRSPVDLASFTRVDLKEWASIDAAVAAIGGEVDAVFNCAGLPQTFPAADVVRVNFVGIRHWTEQWIPRIRRGGAIANISSLAGMGYLKRLPLLRKMIALKDEHALREWIAAHPADVGDGYAFSKELLNSWTQIQAVALAPSGIRINATMPSPTSTPMMKDFEAIAKAGVLDVFTAPTRRRSTAEEQAYAVLFLNSDAAAFISGVCLAVDGGFHGGVLTGEIDLQALISDASR